MSNYIARVELHKANADDYEELHANMSANGYSRTIESGDGTTYQLPTGTYVMRSTTGTQDTALKAAQEAANATGRNYSVIIADWTQATWSGLAIV
jgi:hypothetical protein